MAEAAVQLDDGFTDAERHFFQTGGDVTDNLLKEHNAPEPAAPLPAEEPPAPGAEAAAAPEAAIEEEVDEGQEGAESAPGPQADQGQQRQRAPRRRVSYREYEAAQERAAAAERGLQEQAVRNARIEERLSLLQQALQEPEAPAQQEQRPDPEQDIFGYTRWLENQFNTMAAKVNGYEQQIVSGQAEMENERKYFDSLNTYAARQPDFAHAYNFLIRSRGAELTAERYPQVTEEQLRGIIDGKYRVPNDVGDMMRQEERSLYRNAFESNQDPAARIYRFAVMRGYRTPEPPAAPTNGAAAPGAAAPAAAAAGTPGTPLGTPIAPQPAAPAAAAPARAPSVTDVVSQIQRGQAAARSLGNAGGGSVETSLTPEALANMSDEQFTRVYEELKEKGKEALMSIFGH